MHDGTVRWLPLLVENVQVHLPWLNAVWAFEIIVQLLVLIRGRWEPATRWLEIVGHLSSSIVIYRLITSGPLTWFDLVAKPVLTIILILSVIETCVALYRRLRELAGTHQALATLATNAR